MKTKKKNKEEKSSHHQRVRIFPSEKQGGFPLAVFLDGLEDECGNE